MSSVASKPAPLEANIRAEIRLHLSLGRANPDSRSFCAQSGLVVIRIEVSSLGKRLHNRNETPTFVVVWFGFSLNNRTALSSDMR